MTQERLKVGIIGTGMIATGGHVPAWKNLQNDVEIIGVADIREDRARQVAQTESIPNAFGDWQKMLAELGLDVVSVCTPNAYHNEQTIAALRAGAHVLCEKPVATSRADAVEMFDATQAADRVLFIGHTALLQPIPCRQGNRRFGQARNRGQQHLADRVSAPVTHRQTAPSRGASRHRLGAPRGASAGHLCIHRRRDAAA